jgi:hypothetical protein
VMIERRPYRMRLLRKSDISAAILVTGLKGARSSTVS